MAPKSGKRTPRKKTSTKASKKKKTTKRKSMAAVKSFAGVSATAAAVKDGRLEVATALAMTSDKVTVDASVDPFATKPPDLLTLTFNDSQIGITTPDLVRAFLANLKALLPEIAGDIDRIPENPGTVIRNVARLVRLALVGSTS